MYRFISSRASNSGEPVKLTVVALLTLSGIELTTQVSGD
jgi:hypothetical protein